MQVEDMNMPFWELGDLAIQIADDFLQSPVSDASITSHSRAPYGLFPGCFEQKSYVHSWGPHGPRAAPYEFFLPCGARSVLMHTL